MTRRIDYRPAQSRLTAYRRCSAGALRVPRTPVERIMLDAQRKRMKREFLTRQGLA